MREGCGGGGFLCFSFKACGWLIMLGIPLGFFQATTVIYALELGPLCLRAYLTNYIHLCWVCVAAASELSLAILY